MPVKNNKIQAFNMNGVRSHVHTPTHAIKLIRRAIAHQKSFDFMACQAFSSCEGLKYDMMHYLYLTLQLQDLLPVLMFHGENTELIDIVVR